MPAAGGIDFAGLRSEIKTDNVEMGDSAGGMEIDTTMEEDEPKMESLKDFLAKTPKTNIDWGAKASTPASLATPTPRSRDRAGVRLCRLLIKSEKLSVDSAKEIQGMAGKYNIGGFVQIGKPGFIIVEGLEFNCDIFMDNLERQKQSYVNAGKVSERSGRSFPMELTVLNGDSAASDFSKACESVGLKEKLESAMSN